MSEGLGGTVVLVIIVVSIVFISAYLAYNVNYTKAFRMKDKIIDTIEKYDGNCQSSCKNEINKYASDIGYENALKAGGCSNLPYKPAEASSSDDDTSSHGYCIYKLDEPRHYNGGDGEGKYQTKPGYYYRAVTRINIQIPIVQNIFDLGALYVTGDTKVFHDV